MPFNPRGKPIKEINAAYEAGQINKSDVLAEFTERLNLVGNFC